MRQSYDAALQQVLEALEHGEALDTILLRHPKHADALREDVAASRRIVALSRAAPRAAQGGRDHALGRLRAQLSSDQTATRTRSLARPGLRYVAAAVVVAVAVLGAGLLLGGGGSSVEASTIEGVVVDNEEGVLTVQTVDRLEQVQVPAGAPVSDVAGSAISLDGIEAGEVVVVDVERRGREAVAQHVQRFVESLEEWCEGNTARCRALSAGLQRAQENCVQMPVACRFALERLEQLRMRASDSVSLEELKSGCRDGLDASCREIVRFCREQAEGCRPAPADFPATDRPAATRRIEVLNAACLQGDERACRQLALACNLFADLCPVGTPGPGDVPPTPSLPRN